MSIYVYERKSIPFSESDHYSINVLVNLENVDINYITI